MMMMLTTTTTTMMLYYFSGASNAAIGPRWSDRSWHVSKLSNYDDNVDDDDDTVLLFRRKRSSGRAAPVGPVRASATGCTRSGRTATR